MAGDALKHGSAYVNGVRLHYVTQGAGPLLVLLHGFPEFWYSWRYQIPALAKHFTVVAPDMRGYNESDKPNGVANYHIDRLTGDVGGLIQAFHTERAVIVGHDWGGGVAWAFAANYPHMTQQIVVLNCPHPGAFQKALKENRQQLRRSWYLFYFQLPWLPELGLRLFRRRFIEQAFRGMAARKEAFPEEDLYKYAEALRIPGSARAAINYYRAAFRHRLRSGVLHLPQISSPTLLIWGEEDMALGKELTYDMDEYFSGRFEIKYIPKCGHWVQQEQPELVNQYLLDFLLAKESTEETELSLRAPPVQAASSGSA